MTNDNSTPAINRRRRDSPASRLRSARLAKGFSQADLAFESGVSLSWVSVLERQPGLMTQRVAARLAVALGVPPEGLWP